MSHFNFEAAAEHLVYLYRSGKNVFVYAEWLSKQFDEYGLECRIKEHPATKPEPHSSIPKDEALAIIKQCFTDQ